MSGDTYRMLAAVLAAAMAAAGVAGCREPADANSARIDGLRRDGDSQALSQEVAGADLPSARRAVHALGTMGPKALPEIEQALRDERAEVRQQAALAYGQAAGADLPQVRRLAEVARQDPAAEVRAAAVTAIGNARAVDEMDTLLAALEDPDPTVRARASAAVARIIGRRYQTYVDGTPEERRQAVAALRQEWASMAQGVRQYHAARRAAPGRPGPGR